MTNFPTPTPAKNKIDFSKLAGKARYDAIWQIVDSQCRQFDFKTLISMVADDKFHYYGRCCTDRELNEAWQEYVVASK